MPKRIYGAGEPCDRCKTPTVQGKNGFYCKPCYIAWKNQSGTNTPVSPQNAPQRSFDPIQNDLQVKIDELNQTIARMRTAFQNHEDRIKMLETPITMPYSNENNTGIPIIENDKVKIDFPPGFLK